MGTDDVSYVLRTCLHACVASLDEPQCCRCAKRAPLCCACAAAGRTEANMNAVQYKGWRIEAQSYESEGGRWRPKALVSSAEGGSIRTRPLTWFNETRDTEADADTLLSRWRRS